jgi:hypothetical protein
MSLAPIEWRRLLYRPQWSALGIKIPPTLLARADEVIE